MRAVGFGERMYPNPPSQMQIKNHPMTKMIADIIKSLSEFGATATTVVVAVGGATYGCVATYPCGG